MVKAPTNSELNLLSHTIAHRPAWHLERQRLLERDAEHSYLALDHSDKDPMDQLRGNSIAAGSGLAFFQGVRFALLLSTGSARVQPVTYCCLVACELKQCFRYTHAPTFTRKCGNAKNESNEREDRRCAEGTGGEVAHLSN